jgi:hypothetical protein
MASENKEPEGYWERFGTIPGGVIWTSGSLAKKNDPRLKNIKRKRP